MSELDRERRLEELFQLAVDLPEVERESFYARHCTDDPSLRVDLEALLEQDDEGTKDFLQSPILAARETAGGATTGTDAGGFASPGASYMPERIGRYLILERIGEGGMGAVYLAEQEHPVRRRVALKIVKPGMDTERVIQRFELERQALAMMDHPCIARIFDGGATPEGRPYFVMEYAPGKPIQRFCDEEHLDVAQRLELFCSVCEAVQHAHQKGIIHRDIKPTNVLVSRVDDRIVPKVIDFGIARATTEPTAEQRRQTADQEVVGTSYYMSPEQAAPEAAGVDTRADIYSLGVVLYELLTGVLPFDTGSLRGKTVAQVQEFLRDTDPPAPSTRVSRLGDTTTTVAASRATDPRGLVSLLSGDLDWITLRAMEKEPARRYATATGLAADVRRYLAHEPVVAGPPDVAYRVRKFIRRNRATVVSASLVVAALVAGIIGTTWGMLEAAAQRDRALAAKSEAERAEAEAERNRGIAEREGGEAERQRERAEAQLAEAERARNEAEVAEEEARRQRTAADAARSSAELSRELAESEARRSRAITDFLVNTVALADPSVSMDREPSLEKMLLRAGERIETVFQGVPEGEATVRKALGEALHSLGNPEAAERHLRRALAIQENLEDTQPRALYETMSRLAQVYGESDSEDAFRLSQSASYLANDLLGEGRPRLEWELDHMIGDVIDMRVDHASEHFESVRLLARDLERDEDWLLLADVLEFLGYNLGYHWGSDLGIPYLEETLAIRRRVLPPTHPEIARAMNKLVTVLNLLSQHERAEELVRESLDIYVQAFPSGHWLLAETRSLLGECLSGQGAYVAAEELLASSHGEIVAARGLVSRAGIDSTYRLIRHYEATSRDDETGPLRDALAEAFAFSRNAPWNWGKQSAAFGEEHAELVRAVEDLDAMMMNAARLEREVTDEATLWQIASLIDEVIELRRELFADDDPRAVIIARLLAEYSQIDWDQTYEIDRRMCEEIYRVIAPYRDRLPEAAASSFMLYGRIALQWEDDAARAEEFFGQAWELRRQAFGLEDARTLSSLRRLLWALIAQSRFEQAKSHAALAWEACRERFGVRHHATIDVLYELSVVLDEWGRPTALETYLEKHLLPPASEETEVDLLEPVAYLAARTPGFSDELYRLGLAAAERACELHPGHPLHAVTRGQLLYRLERHGEAVEALELARGLRSGPDPVAEIFLALARRTMLEPEAAEEHLEELARTLDATPFDLEVDRNLQELSLAFETPLEVLLGR